MLSLVESHEIWSFLALMIAISLGAFGLAALRKINLFESPPGLALLLIVVWSPNISAYIMTSASGRFEAWFATATAWPASFHPWPLAGIPIAVVAITLMVSGQGEKDPLDARSIGLLIAMNLALGPLGEEFGLRGYLLPLLLESMSFLAATLALGAIWALWHLPLWFVESPQAKIPFAIFFATVMCFSVIIGKVYVLSSGSVWPAVLFHFLVNAAVGWAEATGRFAEHSSYRLLLPGYGLIAAVILGSQLVA